MLKEKLIRQGDWLFRWRSYIPLLIIPVIIYEFRHYNFPLNSDYWDDVLEIICFVIALFGLGIRVHAVGYAPAGTSGRNTNKQKATQLNTTGMYSLCRNPLYLGNFFMVAGVLLFLQSIVVLLVFSMFFWLYYERIILSEEEFLHEKFGDEYIRWVRCTRVIIPRFTNWEKPSLPFSWRTVLRREYSGFFGVVLVMTLFEIISDLIVEKRLILDNDWVVIFSFGLFVYLTLRTLKKKTRLLHEAGR